MYQRFRRRQQDYWQDAHRYPDYLTQLSFERSSGQQNEKNYRTVELRTPQQVVQYSKFVQNSISSLDLANFQKFPLLSKWYPEPSWVDTEEKCQKFHCEKRNLLYRLNLDLPKSIMEWSLTSKSCPKYAEGFDSLFIARVGVARGFYCNELKKFFEDACWKISRSNQRLVKLLRLFMKVGEPSNYVSPRTFVLILDCLSGALETAELARRYFTMFHYEACSISVGRPEKVYWRVVNWDWRLGNSVYQVYRKSTISERKGLKRGFMAHCFLNPLYTSGVLKFLDSPHLCRCFIDIVYTECLKGGIGLRSLTDGSKSESRRALLLHLFWTFKNSSSNLHICKESLRLVWNTVNDALFSHEELRYEFCELRYERIAEIYQFYSTSVEGYSEKVEPRSLQQHCRTSIRKQLCESGRWFPRDVKQLVLPKKLQSYLLLEKQT